jgi:hypothetical protein
MERWIKILDLLHESKFSRGIDELKSNGAR